MTKTVTKRQKVQMPAGIRNKLMASVSMVLVAAIMMVSSTYAWFTLSTAPEVKGITTNVGANGNLEIALLNAASYASAEDDLGILSKVGDSMDIAQSLADANATWGNLIDLSHPSYGLDSIVLNPAVLNITEGADGAADTVTGSLLMAPSYGSDGRVISVNKGTVNGVFNGASFMYGDSTNGVRAIGLSSGITQRITAYNNARAAILTYSNSAKQLASNTLRAYGETLSGIMMNYINVGDTATITEAEVTALKNLVNDLKAANTAAGDAIKSVVLAASLGKGNGDNITDDQVAKLQADINGLSVSDLRTTGSGATSGVNLVKPDGINTVIGIWEGINTSLTSAAGVLPASGDTNYVTIKTAVDALVNPDKMVVGGVEVSKIDDAQAGTNGYLSKADAISAILSYFTQNGRVDMVMKDGSGVYAELAELVGNYTASGLTIDVSIDGMNVPGVPIAMSTEVTDPNQVGALSVGDVPDADVGENTVIADTYGYAIDFGFRTNAAGSNLMLQTKAAQRVYGESEYLATQGGGSYLEFRSANTDTFSVAEIRALMSAIRVVFVDDTGSVLGVAAADITSNTEADGTVTYTGGTELSPTAGGKDGGLQATLALYNYTITALEGEGAKLTLGKKLTDNTLTALTQNVAKKVSAIVYLDGDLVDNTMVANAQTSMTGALNLQFSSDATLVPMDNSALYYGKDTTSVTPATYKSIATAGNTFSFNGLIGTVKAGYTIYEGQDGEGASTGTYYYKTSDGDYTLIDGLNDLQTAVTISSDSTTPPAEET